MIDRSEINAFLVRGYCRYGKLRGFVWDHVDLFSDKLCDTLCDLDKQRTFSKRGANPKFFDLFEIVTHSEIAEKIIVGKVFDKLLGQDFDEEDEVVTEVMTFITMKNFMSK